MSDFDDNDSQEETFDFSKPEDRKRYMRAQRVPEGEILEKLFLELSCRENNQHISVTNLGGNANELFVLLQNNVFLKFADEKIEEPYFENTDKGINFYVTKNKEDMGKIRPFFTEFVKKNFPETNVSFDDLVNLDWLNDHKVNVSTWKLLIKGVKQTSRLRELLKAKQPVSDALDAMFKEERKVIDASIRAEYELDAEDYLPSAILSAHPLWGVRSREISKRKAAATKTLLGPEEKDLIALVDGSHIAVTNLCFRLLIGLEKIVSWDLDELMNHSTNRIARLSSKDDELDDDLDE